MNKEEAPLSEEGKIGHVSKKKIDRMMKEYFKGLPKKQSAKELAKAEKASRGMEKIFALIQRGIDNVDATK